MTKKRYYCDDELEYRSYGIFDLSKADKSMDDFRDEDGICSWQFGNYLVEETDSMLNGDEVVNRLNEQEEEITSLKSTNMELEDANARLEEKNIELQERNDRQYNRLTHLWECIRNKDYETLQKELEEIEEADKKLQEEWKCYND